MPSAAQDGVFEMCDSDLQDIPGTFTDNGVVGTITPGGPASYSVRIPASSNCKTFQATDLFAGAPAATPGSGTNSSAPAGSGPSGSAPTGGATPGTSKAGGSQPGGSSPTGNTTGAPGGAASTLSIMIGDTASLLALVATLGMVGFGMVIF